MATAVLRPFSLGSIWTSCSMSLKWVLQQNSVKGLLLCSQSGPSTSACLQSFRSLSVNSCSQAQVFSGTCSSGASIRSCLRTSSRRAPTLFRSQMGQSSVPRSSMSFSSFSASQTSSRQRLFGSRLRRILVVTPSRKMTTLNCTLNYKPCQVLMQTGSLLVTYQKKHKTLTEEIPYIYVLAVEVQSPDSGNTNNEGPSSSQDGGVHTVSVVYARPGAKSGQLKFETLTLECPDRDTSSQLVDTLEQHIAAQERPRKLVVIINPNSGRKEAEKIYNKMVQPIFSRCGIQTHIIVTQAAKEARDALQTLDLKDVDGVVTVGGDGLYCEVMNGMILRAQKDNGIDVDDPSAQLVPSTIPIGIIPAGTGDWVVNYLHGTRDVVTAAVRIVLGKSIPANAVSVHQGGQLSAYSGLVLAFGLQGDMMAHCERFRGLGKSRYSIIPIFTVLGRGSWDLEVEYYDLEAEEVRKVSDNMYSVDTYVVSKKEEGGTIKHAFGAPSMHVHTTGKCKLKSHVGQLTKLKDNTAGAFDYDFMTTARCDSYTVRMTKAPTVVVDGERRLTTGLNINCDGEILKVLFPEYSVRHHRHCVRIFGESIV